MDKPTPMSTIEERASGSPNRQRQFALQVQHAQQRKRLRSGGHWEFLEPNLDDWGVKPV